jgi:hypothetical protein
LQESNQLPPRVAGGITHAPEQGHRERQHSLLGAADVLEKRASAIHDWPIDEGPGLA